MTRFIAEIGSNHNNDLGRCLQLVDAAAEAGCGAVKLQVFRVEELFAPQALEALPELQARRAWELPLEFLGPVRERCQTRGVELGATPFAPRAIEELADHVDFFKIASYELPWPALIQACAASGKPLVLSTGMATLREVETAVEIARSSGVAELRLLHCVSGYPTPPEQANLRAIATLRDRFAVPVGWSDHSCCERVVHRAVNTWGAGEVELHIDLDGQGHEAGEHNWTPTRLRALIASLAAPEGGTDPASDEALDGEAIDGDGVKRPMPVEEPDVPWRADPVDGLRPARKIRPTLRVGV